MSFPRAKLYRLTIPYTVKTKERRMRMWLRAKDWGQSAGDPINTYEVRCFDGTFRTVTDVATSWIAIIAPLFSQTQTAFGVPELEKFDANTQEAIFLSAGGTLATPSNAGVPGEGTTRTFTAKSVAGNTMVFRYVETVQSTFFKRPWTKTNVSTLEVALYNFIIDNPNRVAVDLNSQYAIKGVSVTGRWNSRIQSQRIS